jgi:hypothetical protein
MFTVTTGHNQVRPLQLDITFLHVKCFISEQTWIPDINVQDNIIKPWPT